MVLGEPARHGRHRREVETTGNRRYSQLMDMMSHFNPDFDERKYWTYGCNCLILGDRPMSDPGHGPPKDALDTVCKAYKDCLKCARQEHGDSCIGEFTRYKFELDSDVTCQDKKNSCKRQLCECDAMFARDHVKQKHVFNMDYHMFWSSTGWDPKENCPQGGGGIYVPECCGGSGKPFYLYNSANHVCCANGKPAKSESQC